MLFVAMFHALDWIIEHLKMMASSEASFKNKFDASFYEF